MATKNEFGINLIDFAKLHTQTLSDDMILNIAQSLHDGELVVSHKLAGMKGFELERFDWSTRYGIGTAAQFQLNLHSLKPVEFLTRAYKIEGRVEHLELALKLIESWAEYEADSFNAQINPNLWDSRCAAFRTESLVYFVVAASEAELLNRQSKQILMNILRKHERFLCDENNYQFYGRYSVYINRATLYLSFVSEDAQRLIACARDRLRKEIEHCFTAEMVHIENSYVYHVKIVRLLEEIAEVFDFVGDDFGKEIFDKLEDCGVFLTHMIKPDRRMPLDGDTQGIRVSQKDYKGKDTFTYAATGGEEGRKPSERAVVFPQAGYFAAREYWDGNDSLNEIAVYSDSVWTMFKSGCKSTAHKHCDDLSFALYAKGYDVFVDSGFFSFNVKNATRRALVSALAHNTVVVDGESYCLNNSNLSEVGLCDYQLNHPDGYSYVCGFNNTYNNVSIDRHFYYFGQAILIFDDIHSVAEHTYTQLFHLGEHVKVVSRSNEEVLIKIANTGYFARIRQFMPTLLSSSVNSESNISRSVGKLKPNSLLSFDVSGVDTGFVTLITIEDENGHTTGLSSYDYDVQRRIFAFVNTNGEDCTIRLAASDRLQKIFVKSTRTENDFIFFADANIDDVKYAWYIYEKSASAWRLIFKSAYSATGTLQYRFEEGKSYRVKVFATSSRGEQMKIVAANISEHELVLLPQIDVTYSNEGDRFTFINHAEQSGLLYAWYVYRQDNGEWSPIHKGAYTGENTFEYVLEDGNSYRIKAFILGSNGNRRDDIVAEIAL